MDRSDEFKDRELASSLVGHDRDLSFIPKSRSEVSAHGKHIRSGFSILAIRDLQMQCPRLMSSFPHAAPPRRQRPLRIGSVKHATQYIQPGLELMSMDPKRSVSFIGAEVFEDDARLDDVAVRLAADIGANNQEAVPTHESRTSPPVPMHAAASAWSNSAVCDLGRCRL